MAIPSRTKLARYFAELQKIEEHRSAYRERQIKKLYKELLTDLQGFLGVEYAKYAVDDALTYSTLAQKGEYARFLEEVQARLNKILPQVNAEITETVKEMYKTAYEGMVNAVSKSVNDEELSKLLGGIKLTQPQVIKAAVNNPVAKLKLSKTLEKNRKQIVYNIKQTVTVGIMNGDRMTTMASKIQQDVEMNYRKAMLITRTEVHRVRETGHNDASNELDKSLVNSGSQYRLVKIWKTMRDSSVRRTSKADHTKMEGQMVLQDEDFVLDSAKNITAPCPGQSGKAFHDCNCRCKARVDLLSDDEFFQATGRHFPNKEEPKKKPKKEEPKQTTPVTEPNKSKQPPQAKTIEEAHKLLIDEVGFDDVEQSFKSIDKQLQIANTNQLAKLESKFGVIHKSKGTICSVSDNTSVAYVSAKTSNPSHQNLSLCPRYYTDRKQLIENEKHFIETGYSMPCDLTEEELSIYTVTHEYGHLLQNILRTQRQIEKGWTPETARRFIDAKKKSRKAQFKWYSDIEKEVQKECFEEICDIAKETNPNFKAIDYISKYGKSNMAEFFAEVFANSQLSKPNELGKAMNVWLKRKGLILNDT